MPDLCGKMKKRTSVMGEIIWHQCVICELCLRLSIFSLIKAQEQDCCTVSLKLCLSS